MLYILLLFRRHKTKTFFDFKIVLPECVLGEKVALFISIFTSFWIL